MAPTPVLLPGKSHGRRSLVGCSPWGREESDTTEQLHFHFSLSCIGERNDNPLQCSCLENPRDRGAWWAAVYGIAQSRTRLKRLSSSSGREGRKKRSKKEGERERGGERKESGYNLDWRQEGWLSQFHTQALQTGNLFLYCVLQEGTWKNLDLGRYFYLLIYFLKLIFDGVQLLYSVVLVSAVQQNESATHIPIWGDI